VQRRLAQQLVLLPYWQLHLRMHLQTRQLLVSMLVWMRQQVRWQQPRVSLPKQPPMQRRHLPRPDQFGQALKQTPKRREISLMSS
jgi:hypothetical protein